MNYTVRLALCSILLLVGTSYAEEKDKTMELFQQINSLQTTQIATVFLVPPDVSFRVQLNENLLRKWGCTYTTRDHSSIASLVGILERADVKVAENETRPFDTRQGIFLTLADGTQVKLLLGQNFNGLSTVRGAFNNTYVTAAASPPQDLSLWATQTGAPVGNRCP